MKLLFVVDVAGCTNSDEITPIVDTISEAICGTVKDNAMFKPTVVKCCTDSAFEAAEVAILRDQLKHRLAMPSSADKQPRSV